MGRYTLERVREENLLVGEVHLLGGHPGPWPTADSRTITADVRVRVEDSGPWAPPSSMVAPWFADRSFLDVRVTQFVQGGEVPEDLLAVGDFVALSLRPGPTAGALQLVCWGKITNHVEPLPPPPVVEFPGGVYRFACDPSTIPEGGVKRGDPVWYDSERHVVVFGNPPEGSPPRARGAVDGPVDRRSGSVEVSLPPASDPESARRNWEREVRQGLVRSTFLGDPPELDVLGRPVPTARPHVRDCVEELVTRAVAPRGPLEFAEQGVQDQARGLGAAFGALGLLQVLRSLALIQPGQATRPGNANARPSSVFPGTHSSGPPPAATGGA